MISSRVRTKEWIEEVASRNNNADKILVEKVIRALLLLEGLASSGLEFVFKGGTAVMLLQGTPRRFSIDIDIIVPRRSDFPALFASLCQSKGFSRAEERERKAESSIEKCHYKFHYHPAYADGAREDNILLDILIEEAPYKNIHPHAVNSPFVEQTGAPLTVNIPDSEEILGDKLTAFAPNTTGVPYVKNGNSAAMEIIKQLYDIGNLFTDVRDISKTARTFHSMGEVELRYRSLSMTMNDVLEDIMQTSLLIATRGQSGKGDFFALQSGISQLSLYIFSERFHIEQAAVFAARAAYIAMLIRSGETRIERFQDASQVTDWTIEQPFETKLNKLKKTNPEAFFYWYQVYLLQNKSKTNAGASR